MMNKLKTYLVVALLAVIFLPLNQLSAQALSGTYTVPGDFATITAMANALNTNGVSGPVTINVANGTYSESLHLRAIPGASATNTITIDGGDSSRTIISHDGTTDWATLTFEGTKYVTIKNVGFVMTKGTASSVAVFSNTEYNTFSNCEFKVQSLGIANIYNIAFSQNITSYGTSGINNYITFQNNRIVGGQRGITIQTSEANINVGNKFYYNTIDSVRQYGIYAQFQDSMEVVGNKVDAITNAPPPSGLAASSISYGMTMNNLVNSHIKQNYVWSHHRCLSINNSQINAINFSNVVERRFEISNNMFYSKENTAMYLYYADSMDVWHNTAYSEGSTPAVHIHHTATNTAFNNDFRNNIFSSNSNVAFQMGTGASGLSSGVAVNESDLFLKFDNNLYYTGGATVIANGGNTYATLAAYQAAAPLYNTSSIEADPDFISVAQPFPDLHIAGIVPYERGDNSVGIIVDIDGKPRPGTNSTIVNIGADEFVPALCLDVTNVIAKDEDFDSVTIAWTSNTGWPLKEFQYSVFSCDSQLVATDFVATDSVRVGGLQANSCYYIMIREVCDRGDTSNWRGTEFYTKSRTPYFQDFTYFREGHRDNPWPYHWTSEYFPTSIATAANPTPRWQAEVATGQNQGTSNTGPIFDHTQFGTAGGHYLLLNSVSSSLDLGGLSGIGDSAQIITDPIFIDPSIDILELKYWYFMHGAGVDGLKVFIREGNNDTLVAYHEGAQHALQTDEWSFNNVFLENYANKEIQLVFRGYKSVSGNFGDVAIDDISLKEAPRNDAAIVELVSDGALCAGTQNPVVVLRNFAYDTLKTVNVISEINSVLDTVVFTGNIASGDTAHVTLNSVNISATQLNDLVFYTSMPNGVVDEVLENDTLKILNQGTGLSGVYTVDPSLTASATNFVTLESLSDYLNDYGVCGPTTINIANGVYNEPLFFERVAGLSSVNHLVIDGGDSSRTIITHDGSTRFATLTLSAGANHIHIKNITFERTYLPTLPDAGATVLFAYNPMYDTLSNCEIRSEVLTATGNNKNNIAFSGDNDAYLLIATERAKHIVFENNRIIGGAYAIRSQAQGTSTHDNVGLQIVNNIIDSIYTQAIYLQRQDSLLLKGNNINVLSSTANSTGLNLIRLINSEISANYIWAKHNTLAIDNQYADTLANDRLRIINNMVYSAERIALRIAGASNVDIIHNTIYSGAINNTNLYYSTYIAPVTTNRIISSYDIRNNIFTSNNSAAFYANMSDTIYDYFDNNIFFSNANNVFNIYGDYLSLAQYQSINSVWNQNSIEAQPVFMSNTDLHIDPSSKIPSEMGDNSVGISVDIDGNPRPYPNTLVVNIGADEYLPTNHCYQPINGVVVQTYTNSVSLQWSSLNTSADYEYMVFPCGDSLPAVVIDTTNLDSITILGLDKGTCYEFYVRALCSIDDSSLWSGPIVFNTLDVPYYPIGEINTSNVDGIADSIGTYAWTSGTVVGENLSDLGLNFTLIDMSSNFQEGIRVYSDSVINGYTVSEGDSLMVKGEVKQNFGLTEFHVDSIEVISSGNVIPAPIQVSVLDENTESKFVEMKDFVLLEPSQTGSYEMRAYNGNDTITIFVSEYTDVSDSLSLIANALNVGDTLCVLTGIGSQYDTSAAAPYLSGYQIIPMYYANISVCRLATGIENYTQSNVEFSFYPNPTKGEFVIESSGLQTDNAVFTIHDISGKVIVEESINNSSQAFKKEFNLDGQAKGLYFISIIDGNNRVTKKLILQ